MFNGCCGQSERVRPQDVFHSEYCPNKPLADWEKELLSGIHLEGEGQVTFHIKGGDSFTLDHIRVDSISGIATNMGIITAELFSDENKMFHIPNVLYWTVE